MEMSHEDVYHDPLQRPSQSVFHELN